MNQNKTIFRGRVFSLLDDPVAYSKKNLSKSYLDLKDGALVVDTQGIILDVGSYGDIKKKHPSAHTVDYSDRLILPGLIDTHLHMPQIQMIGSFGAGLLDWLKTYTFPEEIACKDEAYCFLLAKKLIRQLIGFGTTCAAIFTTSHKHSADILFQIMAEEGFRGVAGKVSMNRHAPMDLLMPLEEDLICQHELIKKWHGYDDRLFYALTPRFAPSCSKKMLLELGKIKRDHPSVYVQSHLSETKEEIAWVKSLFPEEKTYFGVYEKYGLFGKRSIFAHGIHLQAREKKALSLTGSAISHCPSSNFFLGSGLCPVEDLRASQVLVSIGSDVGGGTSLSLWSVLGEAYKASALLGKPLSVLDLFYLATLGGAKALDLSEHLGAFKVGYQADFQVIDPRQSFHFSERKDLPESALALLGPLIFSSDHKFIEGIYIRGRRLTGV